MKVFLSICLLAFGLSIAYAGDCPHKNCPTQSPPTNVTTPTTPWKPCPSGHGGILGLLQQVAYLVNNLLNNLTRVLTACKNNPNGGSILALLRSLLDQVRQIVAILIGGAHLTDAQVAGHKGILEGLLRAIAELLNSLLGGGQGTSWCCSRPSGLLGISVDGLVAAVVNLLNGIWPHDCGLLSGLMNQIVSIVNSLLTGLVL